MTRIHIAVAGAQGRMGRMLIEAILASNDMALSGALEARGATSVGHDAAEFLGQKSGVRLVDDPQVALENADVLIDFTRPEATLRNLDLCAKSGIRMVIGTTGFDDQGKAAIERAAGQTAIVFAPNMSVGVNVVFKLLEMAASTLSEGYDVEIIEAHHRHKVDAPSGTALRMGEVVANALGRDLRDVAVFGREGITGERQSTTIGFSTIRGGDIVGDHTVLFAGTGERIEISHRSSSRANYAQGSLRAARFLADKKLGIFDMQDVLGLRMRTC